MNDTGSSDIPQILAVLDFIEAHLQENISVADMAASACFSLFHFSRLFNRVTRCTPYDYLMRRRLSAAADRLMNSDEKIIDIAFAYQFNAPETFSRAFKRVFRVQPRQARQQGALDTRQMMVKPARDYLEFLNSGVSLKPAARSLSAQTIAGVAAPVESPADRHKIAKLWQVLARELSAAEWPAANREFWGICLMPAFPAHPLTYVAGTTLQEGETAPISLVTKAVPALKVAYFKLPPKPCALHHMRHYAAQTWWPQATSAPLPAFELEYFAVNVPGDQKHSIMPLPHALAFPFPDD